MKSVHLNSRISGNSSSKSMHVPLLAMKSVHSESSEHGGPLGARGGRLYAGFLFEGFEGTALSDVIPFVVAAIHLHFWGIVCTCVSKNSMPSHTW